VVEKFVTSISGLAAFAAYFGSAVVLLVLFAKIYEKVTPYKEFDLIAQGNTAAACSFSGALLGFAIPLASVIAHSLGLIDMVIWGVIALAVQVLTFFIVRFIFPRIVADIPAGQTAQGIFLGAVSLLIGILNAACMVE